jgi:hypothetical protein
MLASTFATVARGLAIRASIVLGVGDCINVLLVSPRGKKLWQTDETMKSVLDVHPSSWIYFVQPLPDIFRSVLELPRAETTTSASQLEAQH